MFYLSIMVPSKIHSNFVQRSLHNIMINAFKFCIASVSSQRLYEVVEKLVVRGYFCGREPAEGRFRGARWAPR